MKKNVQWWLPGAEGKENGELLLNGYRVSVFAKWVSSGDLLHNNGNILNITELYPLKWLR